MFPSKLPCPRILSYFGILATLLIGTPAKAVIRDGGIDPSNLGKGEWIYSMKDATNKLGGTVSSVTSTATLFQYYKNIGVKYVLIKVGTGSTNYTGCSFGSPHQVTASLCTTAHANGVWVFGYTRSYGSDIPGEVALATSCFNNGADGFVYDAEAEWETRAANTWITNGAAQAWTLMSTVRSNWPTKFLAHAPFPIIASHSTFPYKEFGYWCDAVMPQVYHFSASGIQGSASAAMNWSDVNWRTWQNSISGTSSNVNGQTIFWSDAIKPIVPVQDVYGPAGNMIVGSRCNGTTIAYPDKDVTEFIDYAQADPNCVTAGGYNGVNFWRADLHGSVQFTNITLGTSGTFTDIVNNIVIDDANATRVGTWTMVKTFSATTTTPTFTGNGSGTDTNSFGTNYFTKSQGAGTSYIQFTPNVKVPGDYKVYQWHPNRAEASAAVPFTISYNGGSASVNVNQTTNAGNWSFVGQYPFAAGTNGNIKIYDNFPEPGGIAMVDGLKMVFVKPTSTPTAPSGLTASPVTGSQINLTWTDNSSNESSFAVRQSTTSGGPYTDVADVAPNTSSYSVTGLSPDTTYYFVVRSTNYVGASANSAQASAKTFAIGGTVPGISQQPQSQSVVAGTNALFSVTATGTASLGYQWRFNTTNIAGATTSSYTRTNVQTADAGNYSVVITNAYGTITSSNAALTVTILPPTITTQPQNSTNNAGTTANFSVTATGTAPLSYQWKKNGSALSNGGNIAGATSSALTLTSVTSNDGADYSVTVTNSAGITNSSAATLVVNSVPSITSNPTSQTNNAGSNAVFTVTASGSLPLSYQWKKTGTNLVNGGNISGATTASLTISSISQADAANYSVVVTNNFGTASSSAAALIVIDPPVITTQPTSRTNTAGTLATFSVVASGTSPAYKWMKNGVVLSNGGNVSGATSATLNLASVSASDAANYSVIISNTAGNVTSDIVNLTVLTPPSISGQPQNQTVSVGANVTFNVTASGTVPLSYRWRLNGTTIAGATNSFYTKNGVETNDAGNYSVVITNVAGSVTSSNASLTVSVGLTQIISVSNLWSITAGSRGYVSIGTTERGIAINTVSNHVLIVSRATNSGSIVAVNADTGADLNLVLNAPTNIVTGGQFFLNKVGVTSNGVVYAANLTTSSGSSPLRIYRWANYSDTPVLAYSGAPDSGVTARWGDSFAIRGSGTGTQILVSGSAATNAVLFTTTNGTNFTPTLVNPSSAIVGGAWSKGVAFGSGNSFYSKNRSATTATNYSFNPGTGVATVNATIAGFDSNLLAIGVDTNHQLMAGVLDDNTTNTSGHILKMYDISVPASPTLLGTYNFPSFGSGTNSGNVNFAAHVDTDGNKFVSIDTQNGVVASAIVVQTSPQISSHPLDQVVAQGQNAIFTVSASGTAPLSYQWKKNGATLSDAGNISGSTTTNLTVGSITSSDEADYTVTVSNPIGSVDSSPASLTVMIPPSIVTDPSPQTINSGDTANFTVTASGTEPLYYQWKKGGVALTNSANVIGATTANLVLANVTSSSIGDYSVIVTNAAGQATSATAHLTVIDPPTITTNPTAQTVVAGTTVTLSGSASGLNIGYQWKKNGVGVSNGGNVSGALTPTLTLSGVSQADVADYSLYVTNSAGNATSLSAHLTVVDAPVITSQPGSRTNNAGTTATFSVTATGQNLTYRWRKNGSVLSNGGSISGATTTTLTIAGVSLLDVGDYSVVLTNIAGNQTSSDAHLTVVTVPVITSQPLSVTNNPGSTALFTVAASSQVPATYQWKKNNSALTDNGTYSGTTNATLTVASVSASEEDDYSVLVSNSAGSTNSSNAHLHVTAVPSVVIQPLGQIKGIGSNVVLTVSATGTAPLSYQWRKDGTNLVNGGRITGATSTNLTVTSATLADGGAYSVLVTNGAGMTLSDDAIVDIITPPVITIPPIAQTNASGVTSYVEVTASGSNLTYQWQKSNIDLIDDATDSGRLFGANTSILTIESSTPSDSGLYRVIVANEAGQVTSAAVNLIILQPVSILTQPLSRTNGANTVATFTVTASGSSLVYQWKKDGTPLVNSTQIVGATTATLSVKSLTSLNNGDYSVVVSNGLGAVSSSNAHLTVLALPAITGQPANSTNIAGTPASFTVAASGIGLGYQWKKAGIPITNNYYVSGANSATLSFSSVLPGDSAAYTVLITNAVGSVVSKPATLKVFAPPVVTAHPLSRTNVSGTTASFTVLCSGTTPLAYQWFKNGIALTNGFGVLGANAGTLSIPGVSQGSIGNYHVVVTNYAGTATSSAATLTVVDAITITSQPQDTTNVAGTTATFSVAVTGSTPGYQWKKGTTILVDGGDISGATTDTLQINNVKLTNAGIYSVTVSNFAGKQISTGAALTVLSGPIFNSQPQDQLVVYGSNAVFSVNVAGTAPLAFQWKKNGTALIDNGHIAGATSSSLTVIGAVNADEANYSVSVSNSVSQLDSSSAALAIVPNVTILKPVAGATIISGLTNVTGTASDHTSVTQVFYSWNGSAFVAASGTTNWVTPLLNFSAGTNTIIVKSVNSIGRESKPVTRNFFYPVIGSLTLITNGIGSMTPNLAGQTLYVGRNYSISAVAGTGQLFSNWTGTYTTNNKIMTFRMLSNVIVQANFVTNLFIPRAGTYNGLFFETNAVNHESSGSFKLVLTSAGAYSGQFFLLGTSRALKGQFDLSGKSTFVYTGSPAVTFDLDLDTTNGITDHLLGTVSNANWIAELGAERAIYSATNVTPRAGKYLVSLAGNSDGSASPGGDGYASVSVNTNGAVTIAGSLSDGIAIAQNTFISKYGQIPLYVPLYATKGSLIGWLTVTNKPTSSVEGDVSWIKKAGTTTITYYAGGFTNDVVAMGSSISLTPGTRGLSLTNGLAIFSGGDLTRSVTNTFTLTVNNAIAIDPGQSDNVLLSIDPNTGIITGSFIDRTTGTKVPVKGVLLQKQNSARGYFLSAPNHVSGSFLIQPND